MELLLIITCLYCCIRIVSDRGVSIISLKYFTIASLLIRDISIVSILTTSRLLCFVVFVKVLFGLFKGEITIKKFPLLFIMILILANYLTISFLDGRYDTLSLIGRSLFRYATQFFTILIGYLAIKNRFDFNSYLRTLYKIGFIVFLYSIFCLLIQRDLISTFLGIYDSIDYGGRIRVPSFTGHVYNGTLGAVLALCCIVNPEKILHTQKKWFLFFSFLILSLVSGFRINIIILTIGLFIIIIFQFKKHVNKLLLLIPIFAIAYGTIPYVNKLVDNTLDMLAGHETELGGSSTNMRNMQYEVAMNYFYKSPYWGNGFSYFSEDIVKGDSDGFNGGLMGGEGYYLLMLIEEGGVQIILSSLFFILTIHYFYKNKKHQESILGLSIIVLFITLCIGTRPDQVWIFILPILGSLIKIIQIYNNEDIRNNASIQC